MITAKKLEFFEKKMQNKKYCAEHGSKILAKIAQQIKDSINLGEDLDNWSDYSEWDQYSVWSKN